VAYPTTTRKERKRVHRVPCAGLFVLLGKRENSLRGEENSGARGTTIHRGQPEEGKQRPVAVWQLRTGGKGRRSAVGEVRIPAEKKKGGRTCDPTFNRNRKKREKERGAKRKKISSSSPSTHIITREKKGKTANDPYNTPSIFKQGRGGKWSSYWLAFQDVCRDHPLFVEPGERKKGARR